MYKSGSLATAIWTCLWFNLEFKSARKIASPNPSASLIRHFTSVRRIAGYRANIRCSSTTYILGKWVEKAGKNAGTQPRTVLAKMRLQCWNFNEINFAKIWNFSRSKFSFVHLKTKKSSKHYSHMKSKSSILNLSFSLNTIRGQQPFFPAQKKDTWRWTWNAI